MLSGSGLGLAILAACIVAAGFAILAAVRASRPIKNVTTDELTIALRSESDRIGQIETEQGRLLRQELTENLATHQRTTLAAFHELGESLSSRMCEALQQSSAQQKERLDSLNVSIASLTKVVDERLEAIRLESAAKLEGMRKSVDERLRLTGESLSANVSEVLNRSNVQQKERLDGVNVSIASLTKTVDDRLQAIRLENISKLEETRKSVDERLRLTGESLSLKLSDALNQSSALQKERLDGVNASLVSLAKTVDGRLEAIRLDNAAKLEEMRKTVDEKLQST